MAGRPSKQGLDYFPFDTDMEQDKKIRLLEANHPDFGWKIWTKLLPRIYREYGYFFEANNENLLLFSKDINVDINSINVCINSFFKLGLFDRGMYDKYKILTSKRVQTTYLIATQRRKFVDIIENFLLLSYPEIENCNQRVHLLIYADINCIFEDNILIHDYKKYASSRISFLFLFKEYLKNINKGVTNENSEDTVAVSTSTLLSTETQGQFPDNPTPDQQVYDPKIPVIKADRPSEFNWSWEKAYFSQDKEWIAAVAKKYAVSEETLEEWFEPFFEWLEVSNGKKSAEKMWNHFANWFPLRRQYVEQTMKKKEELKKKGAGNTDSVYENPTW